MSKLSLLHAVCGVAILASVPAFAQTQRGGDLVSPSGVPNPDAKQPATGPLAPQNNGANTTSMVTPPAKSGTGSPAKSGADSSATAEKRPMHREAMMHKTMSGKTDTSQDAAVDQLNDQSFKAASQGQSFTVAGTGGMSSSAPVQGGSMSSGASSGAPSGGSMPASGAMTNPTK